MVDVFIYGMIGPMTDTGLFMIGFCLGALFMTWLMNALIAVEEEKDDI